MHPSESLFHAALPAAISFNDGGLKGIPFELGCLQGDIPGSDREAAAVGGAAIAPALLIALVPGRLGQFLCLGFR